MIKADFNLRDILTFQTVMNKTAVYDTDGDGLIENSGFADQTFDAWPVTGPRYLSRILVLGCAVIMFTGNVSCTTLLCSAVTSFVWFFFKYHPCEDFFHRPNDVLK